MAATFAWYEDNGAATGSPSKGTTRGAATNVNWKNVDDTSTDYSSSPLVVPAVGSNYSFPKYTFAKFTGTFTEISNGIWSANTAMTTALPSGVTLKGNVTSTYTTPAATDSGFSNTYTTVVAIDSGETVSFATSGPENASPSATLSSAGYSQYMATQMIVDSTCTNPGDTAVITATFRYQET